MNKEQSAPQYSEEFLIKILLMASTEFISFRI